MADIGDLLDAGRLTLTAESFTVLTALYDCYHCNKPTAVYALAVRDGFTCADRAWDQKAVLSYVRDVQPPLDPEIAPATVRLVDGQTTGFTYWMNHCSHCDYRIGDHYLHQITGPFFPVYENDLVPVELTDVTASITVTAELRTELGLLQL